MSEKVQGMSASEKPAKPRVYITRRIPEAGLRLLSDACEVSVWPGEEPPPHAELERELRDADGALTLLTDHIDTALLDACPSCASSATSPLDTTISTSRRPLRAASPLATRRRR